MKLTPKYFLSFALSVLVALQSGWISTVAIAKGGNFGVSAYLCNTPGQISSLETRTEIARLLQALGKDVPEPDDSSTLTHCQDCIVFEFTLAALFSSPAPAIWSFIRPYKFSTQPDFIYFAQGPPLGGRAPPHFI